MIPIGGDHFTSDLSVGLVHAGWPRRRRSRRIYGNAIVTLIPEGNEVEVPSVGDRPSRLMSQRMVGEILEPRARELFEMLRDNLRHAGMLEHVRRRHRAERRGIAACRAFSTWRSPCCGVRCVWRGRRRWRKCRRRWPSRSLRRFWAWCFTDTARALPAALQDGRWVRAESDVRGEGRIEFVAGIAADQGVSPRRCSRGWDDAYGGLRDRGTRQAKSMRWRT